MRMGCERRTGKAYSPNFVQEIDIPFDTTDMDVGCAVEDCDNPVGWHLGVHPETTHDRMEYALAFVTQRLIPHPSFVVVCEDCADWIERGCRD